MISKGEAIHLAICRRNQQQRSTALADTGEEHCQDNKVNQRNWADGIGNESEGWEGNGQEH